MSVEHTLVMLIFVLYLSAFGTCSCIVECCVIFICAWNLLLYCEILLYFSLRVELAVVLWNFLLYLSACGTRSGIVEVCVIFFHILTFLVEKFHFSFKMCVLFFCCCFSCCICHVVLRLFRYLKQLLLLSIWKTFGQTLNNTVFSQLINWGHTTDVARSEERP